MDNILRKAAQLRLEQQQADADRHLQQINADAERQRKSQESSERAAKFIELLERHNVLTVSVFTRVVVHDYSIGAGGSYTTVDTIYHGQAWLVQEQSYDYDEGITFGLALRADGATFECWNEEVASPDETKNLPEGPYVRTTWNQEQDTELTVGNGGIVFAGEEGIDILARAAVRFGITA